MDKSSLCGSMTSNSSAETDSLLGGITVVGCTAEGIAGAPIAHDANGGSPMADKQSGMKTVHVSQGWQTPLGAAEEQMVHVYLV